MITYILLTLYPTEFLSQLNRSHDVYVWKLLTLHQFTIDESSVEFFYTLIMVYFVVHLSFLITLVTTFKLHFQTISQRDQLEIQSLELLAPLTTQQWLLSQRLCVLMHAIVQHLKLEINAPEFLEKHRVKMGIAHLAQWLTARNALTGTLQLIILLVFSCKLCKYQNKLPFSSP